MTRARRFLSASFLGALCALAGCDPFGGDGKDPLVPKPSVLRPESDAFATRATRTYLWKENLRAGGEDSLLADLSLLATRGADSASDGDTLRRVAITVTTYTGPAPAAALARLGFRPSRLLVDSVFVPDPGPDLPFPGTPAVGWRLDTAFNGMRFVRELRGVEVVSLSGKRHQCWAFAETTWRADARLGTGFTWMGREGLVRHHSEWSGLELSNGRSGTLFREILAP